MSQAIERPDWMTEDLLIFEDAVTKFAEKELLPHNAKWEAAGQVPRADEVKIRTTAVYTGTPIMTTLSGARAAALGIAALRKQGYGVRTVQEYH